MRWVSDRLQADLDVVFQAVRQNGLALAWSKLYNPPHVIRTAIRQNPAAAAFVTLPWPLM